jgi:DNA-binding transcriptional regulator WhiA
MALSRDSGSGFDVPQYHPQLGVYEKVSEAMMNFLRAVLLLATLGLMGIITNVHAETAMVNKHLVKLLGKWDSPQGAVIFNANRTCVYKGKKYICAIADGAIQIKKRKAVVVFPYRFQNGQLLISDHNIMTAYTRVP